MGVDVLLTYSDSYFHIEVAQRSTNWVHVEIHWLCCNL